MRFNWLGLVGASFGLLAAMTPSLLPRPTLYEGAIAGIGAALGYSLGTLLSWVIRGVSSREPSPHAKRIAWRALAVAGPLSVVAWFVLGGHWQNDVRTLVGEPKGNIGSFLGTAVVGTLVALLLIAAARGIRRLFRMVTRALLRVVPRRVAQLGSAVVTATVVYLLVAGALFNGFIWVMDRAYAGTNASTKPGVARPDNPERSGSPASLVKWDDLGMEGRNFVAHGPSAAQLTAYSGSPAKEPIRAYVGLDSADTARERADLAVRELDRTGAFDRKLLVVAGTTGTGWLEPEAVDSVEYMWNGDTAIAAIQYSYLPSWISTLADRQKAADAGRELFDAVHARWAELPENHRPRLIAYGLSLGAFSIQAAFGSAGDLAARTEGALIVGSPNFAQPWGDITRTRDPGSPEWRPVYHDGKTVRFGGDPADLAGPSGTWSDPRVVYLQHASDPVVWWNPALILHRPDWLEEKPGPDRTGAMHWFPLLTFAQVSFDQMVGVDVPQRHGHNYASEMVRGWATVTQPAGWTDADSTRLEAVIN